MPDDLLPEVRTLFLLIPLVDVREFLPTGFFSFTAAVLVEEVAFGVDMAFFLVDVAFAFSVGFETLFEVEDAVFFFVAGLLLAGLVDLFSVFLSSFLAAVLLVSFLA